MSFFFYFIYIYSAAGGRIVQWLGWLGEASSPRLGGPPAWPRLPSFDGTSSQVPAGFGPPRCHRRGSRAGNTYLSFPCSPTLSYKLGGLVQRSPLRVPRARGGLSCTSARSWLGANREWGSRGLLR